MENSSDSSTSIQKWSLDSLHALHPSLMCSWPNVEHDFDHTISNSSVM